MRLPKPTIAALVVVPLLAAILHACTGSAGVGIGGLGVGGTLLATLVLMWLLDGPDACEDEPDPPVHPCLSVAYDPPSDETADTGTEGAKDTDAQSSPDADTSGDTGEASPEEDDTETEGATTNEPPNEPTPTVGPCLEPEVPSPEPNETSSDDAGPTSKPPPSKDESPLSPCLSIMPTDDEMERGPGESSGLNDQRRGSEDPEDERARILDKLRDQLPDDVAERLEDDDRDA